MFSLVNVLRAFPAATEVYLRGEISAEAASLLAKDFAHLRKLVLEDAFVDTKTHSETAESASLPHSTVLNMISSLSQLHHVICLDAEVPPAILTALSRAKNLHHLSLFSYAFSQQLSDTDLQVLTKNFTHLETLEFKPVYGFVWKGNEGFCGASSLFDQSFFGRMRPHR